MPDRFAILVDHRGSPCSRSYPVEYGKPVAIFVDQGMATALRVYADPEHAEIIDVHMMKEMSGLPFAWQGDTVNLIITPARDRSRPAPQPTSVPSVGDALSAIKRAILDLNLQDGWHFKAHYDHDGDGRMDFSHLEITDAGAEAIAQAVLGAAA